MMIPTNRQIHDEEAPGCKQCGGAMGPMGKLPAMGLKRAIKVFRCGVCNHLAWNEK
jgi:hypothetical protein